MIKSYWEDKEFKLFIECLLCFVFIVEEEREKIFKLIVREIKNFCKIRRMLTIFLIIIIIISICVDILKKMIYMRE